MSIKELEEATKAVRMLQQELRTTFDPKVRQQIQQRVFHLLVAIESARRAG